MRPQTRRSSPFSSVSSFVLAGLAALPLLAGSTPAAAQGCPGDFDPTFTMTPLNGDRPDGIDLLPDGSFYVAMEHETPGGEVFFAVTRSHADGTPDTTFAVGGQLQLDPFGSGDCWANDVEATSDGGAIAVGAAWDESGTGDYFGVLVKITADGQLDPAFGTGGMVLVPGGSFCQLSEAEVLADGSIVVAGEADLGFFQPDLVLARFHADGTPDVSYGTGGVAYHEIQTYPNYDEVAMGADGSVAVAAQGADRVYRYDATGQADPIFGASGFVEIDVGTPSSIRTLEFDVDGGLMVGCLLSSQPESQFMALRLLPDGSQDAAWGNSGIWIVPDAVDTWDFHGIVADGAGGHYLVVTIETPAFRTALVHMLPGGVQDGDAMILDMDNAFSSDEEIDAQGRLMMSGFFGSFDSVARILTDDAWADLGGGLAGTSGIPALSGNGCLVAGEAFGIDLTGAAPDSVVIPILGYTRVDAPLLGGTLIPSPDVISIPRVTDGVGDLSINGVWNLPPFGGLEIYMQFWVTDPGAPEGYSASNGLLVRIP